MEGRGVAAGKRSAAHLGAHICFEDETGHSRSSAPICGAKSELLADGLERAGFKGFNEVEIFSHEKWALDPDDYLGQIKRAYIEHV